MYLWENMRQQCVFCWRARQAGLCVELVYSWIKPVPEIKAVLSQDFGSPVSDPLSCIKPTGLPLLKGDTLKDLLLLQHVSELRFGVSSSPHRSVPGETSGCIAYLSHQTRHAKTRKTPGYEELMEE